MAYVRQRGNQLAIVRGERDAETGKVEQQSLFTIYSRAEAREILGEGSAGGERRFQSLLESHCPGIRFDWAAIQGAIRDKLEVLPETYEYEAARLHGGFRGDLCAFLRQLAFADPQWLYPAAQLIKGHRRELLFLKELIDWRLHTCEQEEDRWNRDDRFFWRFTLRRRGVPPEIEEMAAGLYQKRRLEDAEAVFRLLVESFPGYAEGHNYLGLIALDRDDLQTAEAELRRAIELGRGLFPRRIAKKEYWVRLETRPYMRGLRNLCLVLNRAGRYEEALSLCDRLEQECGDEVTADAHRASILLNTGRWEEALGAAHSLHQAFPEESLTAALAAYELGRRDEARWRFLHGALNRPRAASMLLGLSTPPFQDRGIVEVSDHNRGVSLRQDLRGYLGGGRAGATRFFRGLLRHPTVLALLGEKQAAVERWSGPHEPEAEWRAAYDRMQLMGTPEFAREQAGRLDEPGRAVPASRGSPSRKSTRPRRPRRGVKRGKP